MGFSELMQSFLFKPLDMNRSSATYDDMVSTNNHAEPHKYRRRGKFLKHKVTEKYYQTGPAGGVNTTIEDMSHFLLALTGYYPEVLPQQVLDSLYTPRIYTPVRYKYFRNWSDVEKTYYGMGFRIVTTTQGDTLVYHGGYVDGFRAGIALNPKENLAVGIILNAPTDLVSKGIPKFFEVYNKYRPSIKSDTVAIEEELAVK
jgi:beta-lactamase class C